jgi:glycosyltransferase involved in cell wall biosynthesis
MTETKISIPDSDASPLASPYPGSHSVSVKNRDNQTDDLVAVIPVHNNEATIGSVIIRTSQYVDRIIVVDDGSTDKSAEVARLAGAEVIPLHIRTGKPYATLLGLKSALSSGCTGAVVFDADGHEYTHDIPKIAARVLIGDADLVIGSHYIEKTGEIPFLPKLKSQLMIRSRISAARRIMSDPQSDFRAFSRKALENLDFKTNGINIETDIINHFLSIGLIVDEIQLTNLSALPADTHWGYPIKVLAAMPALNEEERIAKTIVGARKYVDQILVVDDGSTDATAEIARSLGALVICHEKNGGYGAALQTIFSKARELHVEALVILDSDGQHNPADVGRLLEALVTEDVDVVIGSRFVGENHKDIPGYRKVGMKVLDGATMVAGVADISDSQSGFRAYGRRAIEKINLSGSGMSAGSEILIQISDHHLKIAEVPITVRYDIEGTSSEHPVKHGVLVLYKIIGLISYRRPLPAFGIPGVALIITGMIAELWVFEELRIAHVFHDILAIGSAFIMILGMLLLITGLILNYLVIFVKEQSVNI